MPVAAAAPRVGVAVEALLAASVAALMTVSANLLEVAGIPYAQPGGPPPAKLHPATDLLLLATALHARAGGLRHLAARAPALVGFLVLLGLVIADATLTGGVSGSAVYVESEGAAGLVALLCLDLDRRQARRLGLLLVGLAAANVVMGLGELATGTHAIPIFLEANTLVDAPGEFRGAALYDHPLTGAAATAIAVFAAIGLRLRARVAVPLLALLGAGLLQFGGRAALLVTVASVATLAAGAGLRAVLHRRVDALAAAAGMAGFVAVPAAAAAVLATSGLGARIADKLYLDPSAASRSVQWRILGLLDTHALLFGSPISATPDLVYRLGLRYAFTGVESFWLMALLNLGLVGFALYVAAFAAFGTHLWRRADAVGRTALLALLLIASTSNSLGRKSCLLALLAAGLAAIAPRRAAPTERRPTPSAHAAAAIA